MVKDTRDRREYTKIYYSKNRTKILQKLKNRRLEDGGVLNRRCKEYRKKHPCWTVLMNINARCNYKESKYYKKGIKNFLSLQDVEFLWQRDNANLLEWASIDRIDDSKNYTLDNCRFIEFRENCRNGAIKLNKILGNKVCSL